MKNIKMKKISLKNILRKTFKKTKNLKKLLSKNSTKKAFTKVIKKKVIYKN